MGFLDQYDKRPRAFDRLVKAIVTLLLAAVLVYSIYWLFFRNWREESQAKLFLDLVAQTKYEQAYALWGCSEETPCRYYPYGEFLEDWGPESPLGQVREFHLGRSYTQPNGVIIEIYINGSKQPNLWVEKETRQVGFFPY